MNYTTVYNKIIQLLNQYEAEIYSASFIGSNYKVATEKQVINSDIDVLIILRRMKNYYKIKTSFEKHISIGDSLVVNGWGVVSQNFIKKQVIHLLIDPIWNYKNRQPLFRNTIIDYPVLLGNSLSEFASGKMKKDEFLSFGPHKMIEKLRSNDWDFQYWQQADYVWVLKKESNQFANQNSYNLYCSIHSIINTIKFINNLNNIIEYRAIVKIWQNMRAPQIDFVKKVVSVKMDLVNPNNNISKDEAISFLEKVCEWIIELEIP